MQILCSRQLCQACKFRRHIRIMIIYCKTPFSCLVTLYNRTVHFLGQCHLSLLIEVVFPVILSYRCKHLHLFTKKCPLCSPSLPVCFQHYSTCCTYFIISPGCSIQQRKVIGRVTFGSFLASRKLSLIGLVTFCYPKPVPQKHLPRRASLHKNEAYSTAA